MMGSLRIAFRDVIANLLGPVLRRFAFDPRYFELWQRHGYHVLPIHFYSAIPDTRELARNVFTRASTLPGIDLNESRQLELLTTIQHDYYNEYHPFVLRDASSHSGKFRFGCGSIESVDAEVLYSLVRRYRPSRIIEIGAGFSTLIICEAAARNCISGCPCVVTSIDPYPPENILRGLEWPIDQRRDRVQDVPISVFSELQSGDILFIDSSHVCRIGSDVHFEFLEILPRLAKGVVVHIHDIFFPLDYPEEWVKSRHRFWNEQYLLQAFLCGNCDFEVLWGGAWLHYHCPERLEEAFPSYDRAVNVPASFWIRKIR